MGIIKSNVQERGRGKEREMGGRGKGKQINRSIHKMGRKSCGEGKGLESAC